MFCLNYAMIIFYDFIWNSKIMIALFSMFCQKITKSKLHILTTSLAEMFGMKTNYCWKNEQQCKKILKV